MLALHTRLNDVLLGFARTFYVHMTVYLVISHQKI